MKKSNIKSRRDFLKTTGAASLGFIGLQQFSGNALSAAIPKQTVRSYEVGYGPLMPDPLGILNLPDGFHYKVISRRGQKMDDGFLVPGKPDAMATFKLDDKRIIIIRNHELDYIDKSDSPWGIDNALLKKGFMKKLYDAGNGMMPAIGGTTTMIYNQETQVVEKEWLSLAGTLRNCAGGPTPWGSWITCEETVTRATTVIEKDHGFCFEVPASDDGKVVEAIPLKEMGRFNHEAIAVDPTSGVVYLTEDRHDGLFYRFIPNVKGDLAQGGTLQALSIKGGKGIDTRNWPELSTEKFSKNESREVRWITMLNFLAPYDELRYEGFRDGATRFARGEGIWFGEGELFFACTNGGAIGRGQIFRYKPGQNEGTPTEGPGTLELFIESNDVEILKSCDNLTISNWGDLIVCEDDPQPNIVGVTPDGELYRFAENVGFESEFAGACFSPDGSTLFVNIQHVGMTLAITGPWRPS